MTTRPASTSPETGARAHTWEGSPRGPQPHDRWGGASQFGHLSFARGGRVAGKNLPKGGPWGGADRHDAVEDRRGGLRQV